VLVLGATGASGRIATQLAIGRGARVVVGGRNRRALDELLGRGAAAAVELDRPRDELVAAIAANGPYDLIADYVWGAPAEAVFAALAAGADRPPNGSPRRTRYILVGVTAGETAELPAMALRRAPLELLGSGTTRSLSLEESAAAYAELLRQAAAGGITLGIDARPLATVEETWEQPEGRDRRIVFIP
jgi:NADPH:quinone reductase-like Zn-dependent oxidoreductase